jgi:hypothetical protein
MTDLERLWDDLPTPPAPVDAVLRAGRRTTSVRRRRLLLRPVLAGGAVAALAAAFLVGTVVGQDRSPADRGGDPTANGARGGGASPVAFQADLRPARSCDQLLASYVDRGLGLVTAWGWQRPVMALAPRYAARTGSVVGQADLASAPRTSRAGSSATGTNVQEGGVDEPDTVKTDGTVLVRLHEGDLVVYDVTGPAPRRLSTLALPGLADGELLLAGDTVVALGTDSTSPRDPAGYGPRRGTRVLTVSIGDPTRPTITHDVRYASRLLSARQHGDDVRLVLSAGLPDLGFVTPGRRLTQQQALAMNRAAVRDSTIGDWLPTYDAGRGATALLDCRDVAPTPAALGLDTVSVVGFGARSPQDPQAIGLAGATDIAYESTDDLYLAASPSPWGDLAPLISPCVRCPVPAPADPLVGRIGGTTYLFDFALRGTSAVHVASGEVEGAIVDRWSMDSADGTLRVAVGPSAETTGANAIVTFRRDGRRLVEDGRIGGLGRGEEIKAVRWFDGLAILVTYRQLDPMYAVDLTHAGRPRLLGRLSLPGFSDYLHPLGPRRLIGVGQSSGLDGIGAAQVGLFNVRDLAHVRRIDVHRFGAGTRALAGADPRSFTWLPQRRTAYVVVQRGTVGYLATVRVHAGRLHTTLRPVERGTDITQVRTVGLPDGRVVLVTGDDVRFLAG